VPYARSPQTPPPLTPPGPLTPPELDATVAPHHPLPTPQPLEAAREPHPPGHGRRRALFLLGLLGLAVAAAVMVVLFKPSPEPGPGPTPTATTTAGGTAQAPQTFPTDAFELTLPGEWRSRCLDQQDCDGAGKDQWRSAFIKGQGTAQSTLIIDRTRLNPAADNPSLAEVIRTVDDTLIGNVAGYRRAADMPRTIQLQEGRRAIELSFTASEAPGEAGTVFAFKHRNDIYVVTVRGPDATSARNDALSAVEGLEPR
jgi:hypothetical protein